MEEATRDFSIVWGLVIWQGNKWNTFLENSLTSSIALNKGTI